MRGRPDRQRTIVAAGCQQTPIGRPAQSAHNAVMRLEVHWSISALVLSYLLAHHTIPKTRDAIISSDGKLVVGKIPGRGAHGDRRILVERVNLLPAHSVPHAN